MDPHEHLMGPSLSASPSGVWGQGAARSRVCLMERCPQLTSRYCVTAWGVGEEGRTRAGTLWPGGWGHLDSVSWGES